MSANVAVNIIVIPDLRQDLVDLLLKASAAERCVHGDGKAHHGENRACDYVCAAAQYAEAALEIAQPGNQSDSDDVRNEQNIKGYRLGCSGC